jgi:peroxiredoxin family protein
MDWKKQRTVKMNDMQGLLDKAREGVVTVVFKKKGTEEIRIMPCTLNPELLNHQPKDVTEIVEQAATNERFVVWSIDKDAWRSFVAANVIEWYEGYPKQIIEI